MLHIYDRTRLAVLLCCGLNAILGLFGISLIAVPGFSLRAVSVFLGIAAILFGITRIIGFFSNDLYRLAFEHDIVLGSLLILIGITLLLHSSWLWESICLVLGVVVLVDSLFKFRMALEARTFGLDHWLMILSASVVTGVISLICILMPDRGSHAIIVLFGIGLLCYAVMNLLTVLTAVRPGGKKHSIIIEEV